MSKEFIEELLAPCCKLHFATDRSIIGVGLQDVDRDSAQNGKILRSVVFAGSGIIFVEDYIQWPVQLIFYAPMRARHFEHALRRQPLGQDDIVHALCQLALRVALGFGATDGGEARKGGRVRGFGNNTGASAFLPVMTAFAFLIKGEFAAGIGDPECGLHADKQRRVVGFDPTLTPSETNLFDIK